MPANRGSLALNDLAKKSLADALKGYVQGGLGDFAFAGSDLPGFLADTSPVVAAAQPTRQIVRAACRTYARGGGPQNLPGFDAVWSGICTPYLESIDEAPGTGSVGPAFQGGQCPGVSYVVSVAGAGDTTIGPGTATRNVVGPVGGMCFGPVNQFGNTPIGVSGANGCSFSGGGQVNTRPDQQFKWKVTSVSRVSGADNCGNPPPSYQPAPVPPGLPPLPPTSPVDLPGIGPVSVGVSFNPDGTLNITAPSLGIEVNVGDPTADDDGGGGGGGGVGEPGSPGTPQDTGAGDPASGEGGDAEGEAPPGSVLVGVRVDVVNAPDSRVRYTNEVDRGVVYVYMGTDEGMGLEPTGSMLRSGQFFFAQKDYLTKWQVRSRFGYNNRVTPYYREVSDA